MIYFKVRTSVQCVEVEVWLAWILECCFRYLDPLTSPFLEEGAIFSCGEKRRWTTTGLPIRQKALPVVYGLATSMSCVLFATGVR